MIRLIKQWLARRRLQRMVEERRNSFSIQDYRKRREAALKGKTRQGQLFTEQAA